VAYKSVARMFYLDRPSSVPGDKASRYALVISLDDPVRHGSQRHPHLVMHLDRGSSELVVPVHLSDEDRAAGKYEGLCKDGATEVRGEAPKLVAMLLKNVTGKPVFRPGAYTSAGGAKCVRCSLKSSEGSLYPLDKSFLFIHKPTTYIRHGEVDNVEFQRSGGEGGASASAARTFDVAVHCKALGGGEPARTYVFAGIDRAEKEGLRAFLEGRGLRVNEAVPRGGGGKVDLSELGDDDDDEDGACPGGVGAAAACGFAPGDGRGQSQQRRLRVPLTCRRALRPSHPPAHPSLAYRGG
jgi:structure-specific recognition protein 1